MNMIQGIRKLKPVLHIFGPSLRCSMILAMILPASFGQPQTFTRSEVKIVGPLDYGQTSAAARLSVHPPYSAYSFNARPGDQIEVTIQGQGALRGFLANAAFRKLAGGATHFSYTFDPASQPGTYYILVSEEHHRGSSFTVNLERPSTTAAGAALPAGTASPEYLACTADIDCVAVDRAGCCHNGYKEAVNVHEVDAYRAANACQDPHHMCPMFKVVDKRVARCDNALKRCVMLKPEEVHP